MSYKEHESAHLRLTILRQLHDDADYQINESLLRDAVRPYGFSPSRDAMRAELRWLEDMALVRIEDLGGFLVARLTERGADVATGAAKVDGIKRPGP
jgi:repressor of nif and glnA expression